MSLGEGGFMELIAIPVLVMAGIIFHVALYHLMIYSHRPQQRADLTFALACFGMMFYDLFCVGMMNADNVIAGVFWQRLQITSLMITGVLLLWFIADYVELKNRRLVNIFTAILIILTAVGMTGIDGLVWLTDVPAIKTINLPAGHTVIYHEVTPGPVTTCQHITGGLLICYMIFLSIRHTRRDRHKGWPLITALCLLLTGLANDVAVYTQTINSLYAMEYAYLGIVLVVTFSLSRDVVSAAVMKETLELREQEVCLLNARLEERVSQRTMELEQALTDLAEANRELEDLSTLDGLTGVKNRRYFDRNYFKEFKRSHRDRLPLAILMIDIDHFKAINDQHGHLAGDECLRTVARTIKGVVKRPADAVARYGGEEFTVILPSTTPEGANVVAEQIREAVETMSVTFEDRSINPTVSVGVATITPVDINHPEVVIHAADHAMYEAKQQGRNRVCVFHKFAA